MFRRPVLLLCCAIWLCFAGAAAAQDEARAESDAPARRLRVWLPAPLIADESSAAFGLLGEHTQVFSDSNAIAVDYRIKDVGSVGGIMSSIRASSEVAPGALPDLALIRRRDFTPAQARQYMQSMETLFSSSLISDLGNALESGQIAMDGGSALYGLPYFFDVLQAVYNQPLPDVDARLSFNDVLNHRAMLLFPAARATGLNQIVYLQYLGAASRAAQNSSSEIEADALLTVLSFYEKLVAEALINPDVLSWQTPADYRGAFINSSDSLQIGIFNSSDFLAMRDEAESDLYAANVPTSSGELLTTRDGWLWVIITPDQTRQTIAARYLEWMTEPGFHAAFSKALHQLPTQPAILRESLPDSLDHEFFEDLVFNAALPLPESESGAAPRLMHEALAQVLHGDASAAQAADDVINQFVVR